MPPEKEKEVTDDEWEWEYHDTETEDFYVPIVLPTALTTTSGKNTGRKTRSKHQSIKRDENRHIQQQQQQALLPTDPNIADGNRNQTVEITNLNTLRPEVTYKGYTYTCDWATTIGTDMFFAKQDSSETTRTKTAQQRRSTAAPAKPAQVSTVDGKEANTSLLGTSRVKLVAKQIRKVAVAPHPGPQLQPEEQDLSETVARPTSSDAAEVACNTDKSQQPSLIPQSQPSPAAPVAPAALAPKSAIASSLTSTLKRRQQQESFLRRLVEIKRQRGDADADAVPMYGVGWGPLKHSAEKAETAVADGTADQNTAGENSENITSNGGGGVKEV